MNRYEMGTKRSRHGTRLVPKAYRTSSLLHRFLTSPSLPRILVVLAFAVCLSVPSAVLGQIARFDNKVLTWEGTGVRPANGHSSAAVKYTATGLLPLASSEDTTTNYNLDNSPVAIWKEICNVKIDMPAGGSETVYVTMTINESADAGAQLVLTSQGERWQLSSALRASIGTSPTKSQTGSFPLSNVVISGKIVRQTAAGVETAFALSSEASIVPSGEGTYEVIVRGPAADMQYSVRPGNGMPNSGDIAVWRLPSSKATLPLTKPESTDSSYQAKQEAEDQLVLKLKNQGVEKDRFRISQVLPRGGTSARMTVKGSKKETRYGVEQGASPIQLYPKDVEVFSFNSTSGGWGMLPTGNGSIWCFIGPYPFSIEGYTFEGDESDPLTFLLLEKVGLVYLHGKGKVTSQGKETKVGL